MRKAIILGCAVTVLLFAVNAQAADPSIAAVWNPEIPDHLTNPGGQFVADCFVNTDGTTPQALIVKILDPGRAAIFQVEVPGGVEYHLEWNVPNGLADGMYEYHVEYQSQEGDNATLRGGILLLGQFNALCAVKFHDINGNGVLDDGEPFLEGWEFCASGPVDLGCALTDQDGVACFFDITPGLYELCETGMDGWEITVPEGGCSEEEVGADSIIKVLFGNREVVVPTESTTWGRIKNIYR